MKSIPLFILTDGNYAAASAALIISIIKNTQADVSIYIIDIGLSALDRIFLEQLGDGNGIHLEVINANDYRKIFESSAIGGGLPRATSDKLLVPYMKPDIDKAIILDADMIALGGVEDLWNTDLEGKVLAAVPSYGHVGIRWIFELVKGVGINPCHKYFDSGTLVMDCRKWRDMDMIHQFSRFKINFDTKRFRKWDEIVLNLLLEINDYKVLDPQYSMTIPHLLFYRYNRPYEPKRVIEEHFKLSKHYRPKQGGFVHFKFENVKPWNIRNYFYPPAKRWVELPYFREFWYYLRHTPFYECERMIFLDKQIRFLNGEIAKLKKT